jgi:MerR family transcriptional regulator, copper efflux regulator
MTVWDFVSVGATNSNGYRMCGQITDVQRERLEAIDRQIADLERRRRRLIDTLSEVAILPVD